MRTRRGLRRAEINMKNADQTLPAQRTRFRRLVLLIDSLYEAKRRLICSAQAEPGDLYPQGDGSFEFARTASRLEEMRSSDWAADWGAQ